MKRLISFFVAAVTAISLLLSGVSVSAATVDLELTAFTFSTATEVTPGTSVTFSVTIKNKSNASVSEAFDVTFGTVDTTFAKVTYTNGIAAGGSVTVKSQPWKAVAGDYLVVAQVNESGTVSENDKSNNTQMASLRVASTKLQSGCESTQTMLQENGLTTLIFSEDFNDLSTVDTENTGAVGYKWYVARPYGATTLTTDDYSVKNGVMTLHNIKPTYNYGLGTYHHKTKVGFTYNTGYMEVRLRIPRPRKNEGDEKGVPAIWALPPEKLTNRASKWVEMDWMEYWGIDAYGGDYPDGFYTVCLHEQHLTGSTVTTHYKNRNYGKKGLGDGEWHVMGWLWQEGLFITYLDGVEVLRQTYGKNVEANPMPSVSKGETAAPGDVGVYSMLDTQYNPIIIGGSKDNPMELDYVRVWNGNRSVEPEDMTGPSITAEEFVYAYASDDDGEPIKTMTEDCYRYVLMGESDWNSLPATWKTKVNTLLAKNGQPTFDQLLAQAKQFEASLTATTTKKETAKTTVAQQTTVTRPAGQVVTPTNATVTTTARPANGVTQPTSDRTTVVVDAGDSTKVESGDEVVTTEPSTNPTEPTEPSDAKPKAAFPWVGVAVPVGVAAIGTILALIRKLKK